MPIRIRHKIAFWLIAAFALLPRPAGAQGREFDAKTFFQTFSSRTATVNGITLHYVTGGHGDPVVLIHGYPETWYDWRRVMPALAAHYTVIAPDMRGLGDSSRPADGDYTKKSVADDIYKLTQALGYKRVFLAAQDMGFPVALAYAAAHPEGVRRMVMIEGGVSGFGLEAAEDPARGGSWHFGFFMAPEFPEMLTRGREREFLTAFAYRSHFVYQPGAFTDADINEYLHHYGNPAAMAAGFGYYRAFPQDAKDNQAAFGKAKLTMPILAIGGAHAFGDFGEKNLRNIATDVQGVVFADSGHFVNEERPEELVQTVLPFLAADGTK